MNSNVCPQDSRERSGTNNGAGRGHLAKFGIFVSWSSHTRGTVRKPHNNCLQNLLE